MSDWYEGLPQELKEAPFFKANESGDTPELTQVIADLTSAGEHIGNSIRIPSADAGEEAMATFRAKAVERIPGLMVMPSADDEDAMQSVYRSMGMPENPEDYRLPEIEGVDWANENMGNLKAQAHALGMTQTQFSKMVTDQHSSATEAKERQAHELNEALDALKGEWGAAFDTRLNMVREALKQAEAPDYVMEMLDAGTLPAADLRMFYAFADAIGSEASEVNNQPDRQANITPDEAQAQLAEIEERIIGANAEIKPGHPDYERLRAKRSKLMELAYPESRGGDLRSSFGS